MKNKLEITFSLPLDAPSDIEYLTTYALKKENISQNIPLEIKRVSIDARRSKVCFVYVMGEVDVERKNRIESFKQLHTKGEPVIIVGSGPAGLFCALELAKNGIKSIVCERGKKVQERRKDLKGLNQHGIVDEDSNYCFGEGGAGTYSDGKLYTRSHKRGNIRDVLETLVAYGANEDILIDSRPHIGSNKLPKIITALRESLTKAGAHFLFSSKVTGIIKENNRAIGVKLQDGREILGRAVVLATGHSARDIYHVLAKENIKMIAKPFAMGVRIEQPQKIINEIQYGAFCGHERLPPAYYRLAYTPKDGRGAFSFCMCPGGWIVPASTDKKGLVVNGMSLSKRDSKFANSGLVVAINVDDYERLNLKGPLAGISLQEKIESHALSLGGGRLQAPAILVNDFLRNKLSKDLPETSYLPGIKPADMYEILNCTGIDIAGRLKEALVNFGQKMPKFLCEEAILVGVESRTSSPVQIVRDPNSLCSSLDGLYPCGEGAGYAGGIVSAAIDGIKVASVLKD